MQWRSGTFALTLGKWTRWGTLPWLAALLAVVLSAADRARGEDWPAFRHDLHRSSITAEQPVFPLNLAWRHEATQAPAPAWPEPIRILNRMDFDYAPAPVIAGGIVYLGSTADDTVRALDAATGQERWHFIAGGPVRFAPQISDGKVYFGSDDGWVYCLEAATGKPLWTFFTGPVDERLIGNGRMISRWPLRTGVLAVDGAVYTFAGMWPGEGIYGWSLNAQSGAVNWCNDAGGWLARTTGSSWRSNDPHSGEFAWTGLTPQGPLLSHEGVLVVPLANNMPAMIQQKTGKLISWMAHSDGGAMMTIDGDLCFNLMGGKGPVTVFGRRVPWQTTQGRVLKFPAEEIPQLTIYPRVGPGMIHARGKVSILVQNEKLTARQAYGLAQAGSTLLIGEDGVIRAVERGATGAEDREIWRAAVDGEAREIAFADGRLYVATNLGTVYCFAAGSAAAAKLGGESANAQAAGSASETASGEAKGPAAAAIAALRQAGIQRGWGLVVGAGAVELAMQVAQGTELQLVVPIVDPVAAQAAREKLLATTRLHGRRIHVHTVAGLERLPFAQYFANTVIVAGPDKELAGSELYRLLRPCGGLLLAPGLGQEAARQLVSQSGALPGETSAAAGASGPMITRGLLPGARDWNSADTADARVRWPLRPIWFGGPPSTLGMFTQIGQHPPIAANGRYFVMGDDSLSAIDAYNGTVLWTRPVPSIYPEQRVVDGVQYGIGGDAMSDYRLVATVLRRELGADDEHLYLTLGQSYFGGRGAGRVQMDARTGAQLRLYGPSAPAAAAIALSSPASWPVEIDAQHSGTVAMEATSAGLTLTLTTVDPAVTPLDAWDLFFDWRQPEQRYGLYGPGTFQVIVTPALDGQTPARCSPGKGATRPRLEVTGTRTDTGTQTTVLLPWDQVRQYAPAGMARPASFGFAAILTTHDGGQAPTVAQGRLFCDAAAAGINNGWATVELSAEKTAPAPGAGAVLAGPLDAMPAAWNSTGAVNPPNIDESIRTGLRVHPLTGEMVPRIYRSGTGGCGRLTFSQTSAVGRTSKLALGIYDFQDDSGLRFFGGTASNCGVNLKAMNINAALGLLISAEARSHCQCMIPIRTTMVLAPAERRLNEDWALFFDRDVDTRVRQAALNMGAMGDRRDSAGTLWLSFPRLPASKAFPLEAATRRALVDAPPASGCLQVPMEVERFPGGATVALNSDRVTITGSDRPWLFGSMYRGVKSLKMHLDFLTPKAAMTLDKPLLETPAGDAAITLPFTKTQVFLGHDAQHLYLLATRPALVNRQGKILPWTAKTSGVDADVWTDDSFELFLSDASNANVLHLGVSASGTRFIGRSAGSGAKEERAWGGAWEAAASADEKGLTIRMSLPLATLTQAGLDLKSLTINCQANQVDVSMFAPDYPGAEGRDDPDKGPVSEPMAALGLYGRTRCGSFAPLGLGAPPQPPVRKYTVRLGFAELDDVPAGTRVFDVKLQGQPVLQGFDVAQEAGAVRHAVVREFTHIEAGDTLLLEFAPSKAAAPTPASMPILSTLEVYEEGVPAIPPREQMTTAGQ